MIEHREGYSRRSRAVGLLCRTVVKPTMALWPIHGPLARVLPVVDLVASLVPRHPGAIHEEIFADHWRGDLVRPRDGRRDQGAVLYLHGGAFVVGGLATHRRIVELIALRTGMPVLSVDYRLYPRGRHADMVDDSVQAFSWLVAQGHPPDTIVVVGDSAGGHLAFATVLRALDEGAGRPAGIVGLSPWLDFDHRTKVKHVNRRKDALIPARRLRRTARRVVGSPRIDPLLSPVNGPLAGLPPALIICAEGEVLRCDSELMAERLAAAGVPVRLVIWGGQVHAFPVAADLMPESLEAVEEVCGFAREVVAARRSSCDVA